MPCILPPEEEFRTPAGSDPRVVFPGDNVYGQRSQEPYTPDLLMARHPAGTIPPSCFVVGPDPPLFIEHNAALMLPLGQVQLRGRHPLPPPETIIPPQNWRIVAHVCAQFFRFNAKRYALGFPSGLFSTIRQQTESQSWRW
jgi:hypothetical protein